MRVIGGRHRGRTLTGPKNDAIRPTGDRVRESLFSILGDIEETVVIDAFAGTGALGCEALSRGAAHVHFFDTSRQSLQIVRENISTLEEEERTTVWEGSLEKFRTKVEGAHLAFLDPPYDAGLWAGSLSTLIPMLAPEGLCVCEHPSSVAFDIPQEYELDDVRKYGDTTLTFVRKLITDSDA